MATIAGIVDRFKQDPFAVLPPALIRQVCRELGHGYRERELDPATTVALFVQQVLHGNCPCSEVRHLAGGRSPARFSVSAYCQARARLPLAFYRAMFQQVAEASPCGKERSPLWRGHRTWVLDGSTFSMPETQALRKAFGTPWGQKKGCAFPVAHLLLLFDVHSGMLLDAIASPLNTSDMAHAGQVHPHLGRRDVLIGDQSFAGYAHLALLQAAELNGLFPVSHGRIVDFTPRRACAGGRGVKGLPNSVWVRSLGHQDQLVRWLKPKQRSAWLSKREWDALPDSILVRELQRVLVRPGLPDQTLRMVTTLLDPAAYPAQALLELRLARWEVETHIAELKTTMKLDRLRCKSEQAVRKELAVFCLVYDLVRAVMLRAADRQQVPVDRISFSDTLKWMRHARPGCTLPDLIVNPRRKGRNEPRCIKRRRKKFPLLHQIRSQWRQAMQARKRKQKRLT